MTNSELVQSINRFTLTISSGRPIPSWLDFMLELRAIFQKSESWDSCFEDAIFPDAMLRTVSIGAIQFWTYTRLAYLGRVNGISGTIDLDAPSVETFAVELKRIICEIVPIAIDADFFVHCMLILDLLDNSTYEEEQTRKMLQDALDDSLCVYMSKEMKDSSELALKKMNPKMPVQCGDVVVCTFESSPEMESCWDAFVGREWADIDELYELLFPEIESVILFDEAILDYASYIVLNSCRNRPRMTPLLIKLGSQCIWCKRISREAATPALHMLEKLRGIVLSVETKRPIRCLQNGLFYDLINADFYIAKSAKELSISLAQ